MKGMSGEVVYRIIPFGSDTCSKKTTTHFCNQAIYGHWFHLAYHRDNKFERYQNCEEKKIIVSQTITNISVLKLA